ncbi:MAG: hypothetical protein H0U75_00435 [Legionella sp.]|nr:hypothetical protein [Legionella sp.]
MSARQFFVSWGMNTTQVYPINDRNLTYSHEKKDDTIYFIKKLKSSLKFGNNAKTGALDYNFFFAFENNPSARCTEFTITIKALCDGLWVNEYVGEFTLNDGDWDLDKCVVSLKVETKDIYSCINKNKKLEINILDIPNVITTYANLDYNYEYFYCYGTPGFGACALPGVQILTWTQIFQDLTHNLVYQCVNYNLQVRIYYREVVITACVGGSPNPPPGTGWLLEANNCGTNQTCTYVRLPTAPLPANTDFGFGWWNYVTNLQELPPEPVFKSVVITNTPQSENLLLTQSAIIFPFGGVPTPTVTYHLEVLPNLNSTYVWLLNPGSPVSAIVTGTTHVCNITPNNNAIGIVQVLLTETHGNSYVSTKVFNISQIVASGGGTNQTITSTIYGPASACANQNNLFFTCTKPPTCSTGNPTITWTVTNGTIVSGQGTDAILVDAGTTGIVTVKAEWLINVGGAPAYYLASSTTVLILITTIPTSSPILTINQCYPLEPLLLTILNRTGSTFDVYRDTASLGAATSFASFATYNEAAPALGSHCYFIKEHINCGCNYELIVPPTPDGTVVMLPAIYWCKTTSTAIDYTRNRLFKEAVEYILQEMGCSITAVASDFFDWNAIGDAAGYASGVNYVLANLGFVNTANKLTDITIAQKSDIIDYTSTNAATSGLMTFEKLEKIFLNMFNAYWYIDSNANFRIEHISFFTGSVAYNANALPHLPFNVAKNKYSYDKSKMPKFEKFTCAEMLFTDFVGAQIYYDNLCVDQDASSNVKERSLEFITTDLYSLFLDPSTANKVGFVLMTNDIVLGNYVVAVEQGAISGVNITNGHLSWANLHDYYHRHDRVLITGYMNNSLITFESAKKTKEQKNIVLINCCPVDTDLITTLVKTELGDGIIKSMEEFTETGTLTLNLLHD